MIYFDNNATTQVAPQVFDAMKPYLADFYGNPSSAYTFGRNLRPVIEDARAQIADLIGAASSQEVVFTSGGTESDNWAILGALEAKPDKRHLVTTRVEHEAVRKLCERLANKGFEVTWLDVNEHGALDLEHFKNSLREDTAIVSVMLANNETGILFPVEKVGQIIKERSNALFHVDGVNAVGKVAVNLKNTEIDLFSVSGHKFHAPKGVGALYIREGINLPSFFTGGGQENGRRAGTESLHQIAAIGKAAELAKDFSKIEKIFRLRNKLEDGILQIIPNTTLNGTREYAQRLPNTTNISFENINGEAILAKLSDLDVCVSTGSACNSATHSASPVLQAMEIAYRKAMGAIRFSLGRCNTEDEVDFVLKNLPKIIAELAQINFQN